MGLWGVGKRAWFVYIELEMLDDPLAGRVQAGTVGLVCLELRREVRAPNITAESAPGGDSMEVPPPAPSKNRSSVPGGDHRVSAESSSLQDVLWEEL